eukprot:6577117-Lingulodinium_polyedra.AAC.1
MADHAATRRTPWRIFGTRTSRKLSLDQARGFNVDFLWENLDEGAAQLPADPFGGTYLADGQSSLPLDDPFQDATVEAEIQAARAASASAGG